jgi:protoheme IX farnesyltransferase
MFLWQLPHFLAIAWLYREDYARARMPMLPVVDPRGTLTGRQAALWAATLVPVSELPFLLGMATAVYGVAALLLGYRAVHPGRAIHGESLAGHTRAGSSSDRLPTCRSSGS